MGREQLQQYTKYTPNVVGHVQVTNDKVIRCKQCHDLFICYLLDKIAAFITKFLKRLLHQLKLNGCLDCNYVKV